MHSPQCCLETSNVECIAAQVDLDKAKHILIFCYHPPDQPPAEFFEHLSEHLSAAEIHGLCFAILGDFNAKHQSWDCVSIPNVAHTHLLNALLELSYAACGSSQTVGLSCLSSLAKSAIRCIRGSRVVRRIGALALVSLVGTECKCDRY